jgi:hypothetical protein
VSIIELSIPQLEKALIAAEADGVAANEAIKHEETVLEDLEGLLAVLDGGPEREDGLRQRDALAERLERARTTAERKRRVVEGIRRRLQAAREVTAAQQATGLRQEVDQRQAELRGLFRDVLTGLETALDRTQAVMEAGAAFVAVSARLAEAENILYPDIQRKVGPFELHPFLMTLLAEGERALPWLREEIGTE